MVFKRRKSLPIAQRVKGYIYPRTGWRRAVEYIGHRIRRLPDTPHKIAIGLSCGVFMSFSPLFGVHMFLAVVFALILRGNALAAFLGTFFGNPLTFPFIVPASIKIGLVVLGTGSAQVETIMEQENVKRASEGVWQVIKGWFGFGHGVAENASGFFIEVFLPYLIGGTILGFFVAIAAYFVARPLVSFYKIRHREKRIERARTRAAKQKSAPGQINSL